MYSTNFVFRHFLKLPVELHLSKYYLLERNFNQLSDWLNLMGTFIISRTRNNFYRTELQLYELFVPRWIQINNVDAFNEINLFSVLLSF